MPSVVDWSEFHCWVFVTADLAKLSRRTVQRFGNIRSRKTTKDSANTSTGLWSSGSEIGGKSEGIPVVSESGAGTGRSSYLNVHAAYVPLLAGAVGGSTATYCTHWLDTVKVKMQARPQRYSSSLFCLQDTLRKNGVKGLYQGASPAVMNHTMKASIVFMSYGVCEGLVCQFFDHKFAEELTVVEHAYAGALTGFLASFLLCPVDVVKCRLQAAEDIGTSSNIEKFKTARNPWTVARELTQAEGVRGFYRGLSGIWAKEIPGSFIYFGSYETAKWFLQSHTTSESLGPLDVFCCGVFAGLCFCVTHPIESVKTRVQVLQFKDQARGFYKTLFRVLKHEGIRPLWSGLVPSLLRSGIFSGVQFLTYETVKKYLTEDSSDDAVKRHSTKKKRQLKTGSKSCLARRQLIL